MLSQASQAMVGPARRLLSLECVQNLNTFCVIGCVILSWCHGRVKYFWTPKFAWTHCHDKKFYLTTSLPVALWRLLAGTVMVEGHGIESCHGTAERSQEKVMVLLSVGARPETRACIPRCTPAAVVYAHPIPSSVSPSVPHITRSLVRSWRGRPGGMGAGLHSSWKYAPFLGNSSIAQSSRNVLNTTV